MAVELKVTGTKNLTGNIMVGDKVVVNLNAQISTGEGSSNYGRSTYDQPLYEANAADIRALIRQFEDQVYAMEDAG